MELFKSTNFDFLGKKWPFIGLSLLLTALGLISLMLKGGPKLGIDFRGGALITVSFAERPPVDKVRAALSAKLPVEVQEVSGKPEDIIGVEVKDPLALQATSKTIFDTLVASFGNQAGNQAAGQAGAKYNINYGGAASLGDRLREPLQRAAVSLSDQQLQDVAKSVTKFRDETQSGVIRKLDDLSKLPGVTPAILNVIKAETYPVPLAVVGTDLVGAKIGKDLQRQAVLAVLYALAGMLVYIALRFEWIYGVAAVIAVFHDTLITIGLFSIFHEEISMTVIAALLTLVGYSMNDTIVIFDRIRENLKIMRREPLESLMNKSVNQTLSRTIMSAGLTFLTVIALFIWGGPVLHSFSFALVCGILVGTYSSVFIASPIVLFWHNYTDQRKKTPTPVGTARLETLRKSPAKAVK